MRKGVAGVRLCDLSGCYERWPCHRHGTAAAFPMNGRLVEPITPARLQAAIEIVNERFGERPPCKECGYQQSCWCSIKATLERCVAPEERIRKGWWLCLADGTYRHESMPIDYGKVFEYGCGSWSCQKDDDLHASPFKAMVAAEELYARDQKQQPTPPLAGWEHIRCPQGTNHYRNYDLPPDYTVYRGQSGWTAAMLPVYYESALDAMVEAEAHYGRWQLGAREEPESEDDEDEDELRDGWVTTSHDEVYVLERYPWIMVAKRDPLHPAAEQFPWCLMINNQGGHYSTLERAMEAGERASTIMAHGDND